MDTIATRLKPLVPEGKRYVHDLESLSATIQAHIILRNNNQCRRIDIACQRKACATRWLIMALEERISGGHAVDVEASTLRTVANMLDALAD